MAPKEETRIVACALLFDCPLLYLCPLPLPRLLQRHPLHVTIPSRPFPQLAFPAHHPFTTYSSSALDAATNAINAAPTPLPSFAIPILTLFSPFAPISSTSRNALLISSSNPG